MSHNTHPKKCEHLLNHCEHCDVVYCKDCKKEWKQENVGWTTAIPWYTSNTSGTLPLTNLCHK